MIVTPIKTQKLRAQDMPLLQFVYDNLPTVKENSIIVITSKVVSLCTGAIERTISKNEMVQKEADLYLESNYGFKLTIKHNRLIANAGIDESNGDGNLILWPRNPYQIANDIRKELYWKLRTKNVGIIITDSKTTPLQWGTTGMCLAHSGFKALKDYRGTKDLFGREMKVTQANLAEGLAAAAVLVMGEGSESTPLALIDNIPFIEFTNSDPSSSEIGTLTINIKEDIYAPLLNKKWKKGGEVSC